jgi:UDP-N-acetylmuramoyl-tripeptide--D-alanyl-D-alanine ligase
MNAFAGPNGATVIDDSYNANPASVRGALDYLAGLGGRRILVLGDMAELGEDAAALHAEIGDYARTRTDRLFAIGSLAAHAADAFGAGAERYDGIESLRAQLAAELDADTTVLIKGSRVMGLDELAAALAAATEEPRC